MCNVFTIEWPACSMFQSVQWRLIVIVRSLSYVPAPSTRTHLSHRHHLHHLCSIHRNRDHRHKHYLSMVSTGHIWLSRGSMIARQKFECKIASLHCAGKNSSAKRLSGLLRLQVSSWNSSWVEIGLHVDICIFKIVSRTDDRNGDESGFQQPDLRL